MKEHFLISFKKTRAMNMVGATALVILGLALFFNKINEVSSDLLAIVVAVYALLFWVAFGTARALTESSSYSLQRQMLWLNWGVVCFYGCGLALTMLATFGSVDVMKRMLQAMMPGALFLVLPELINIRALRLKVAESLKAPSPDQ